MKALSLRYYQKLLLGFLIIVLLFTLRSIFFSYQENVLIKEHSLNHLQATVNLIKSLIEDQQQEVKNLVQVLQRDIYLAQHFFMFSQFYRDEDSLQERLFWLLEFLHISSLSLFDQEGRLIMHSGSGEEPILPGRLIPSLKRYGVVADIYLRKGQIELIGVGTIAYAGRDLGTLMAAFPLNENFLRRIMNASGHTLILAKGNTIMAKAISMQKDHEEIKLGKDSFSINGKKFLAGRIELNNNDGEEVAVLFVGKEKDEFMGRQKSLLYYRVTSLIGITLLAVMLAVILGRMFSRSLENLVKITQEVKKGDYPQRREGRETDEIGELTNSFFDMLEIIRNAHRKLAESEEKYRVFMETTSDFMYMIDRDHNFLYVNHAGAEALGYTKEELYGLKLNDILDSKDIVFSAERLPFKDGEVYIREVGLKTKDEKKLAGELKAKPIYDSDGGYRGARVTVWDITERKALEEKLTSYAQELEKRVEERTVSLREAIEETEREKSELAVSKRLANIGEMVARVAHEVRNPLQNIGMGISLLKDEVGDNPDHLEIMEDIEAGVIQLNILIIELLEYSRPISLSYSYCEIDELIMGSLSELKDRMPPGIVVDNKPGNLPLKLMIDEVRIKEVFTNIILNAFEAMPEGGYLKICREKIETSEGERYLLITFADDGPGIKEDDKEKVFQLFFTTKINGTGLGLPICQRILSAHNSFIEIENQPGAGTTVSVYLKMENQEEEQKDIIVRQN